MSKQNAVNLASEPVAPTKKVKTIKACDLKVGDIFVNQSYGGELKVSGVMGSLTGRKETHISFEIGGGTSYPDNCNITILDMDAIHAEAMEMNMDFDEARYPAEHAQEQFREIDPEVRGEVIEEAHAEALEMDKKVNQALLSLSSNPLSAGWHLHSPTMKAQAINIAHIQALEMNRERDWYLERYWDFYESSQGYQAATVSKAHAEALELNNAQKSAY